MNRSPNPQVFLVDRGGPQPSMLDPGLMPCWSFPPPVVKRKKRVCEGVCSVIVLVVILFLVLAALGLGTYQILRLQTELAQLRQDMSAQHMSPTLQRQTGLQETDMDKKEIRQAAHLTVRIEKNKPSRTLRWLPTHGRAYTSGVVYRDGGMQVNETGLYFVYSRLEFLDRDCSQKYSLSHIVFKRREGTKDHVLLEGHREGFCHPKEHFWSSSSYLGAVLQLSRLDWVFVNVSHPAHLSHNHNTNFFGLTKL
ncbi:hypothetical protein AAFF_G00133210 [Aldrovandia affinis]|uniref:Tumor necrosis factor ligand superfamily member 6 n=1 Tax=Aldrovandia affinis TaxID=143900 RepID=A0AAD7RQM0_9TELE|nr:hypothetical protein AAFF_G00133210 [Aldrovandia affinis]